ncbi:MAG: 23S rRNA (pseudouridine(1915)-N(3))-methyltransferase RlmH [Methanothrix sp.]|uniref:23S rRNA (pseudouridine(1915)-N(3))-methyltransferase RlmH n=1 Tax=Methanothrix sp. TaxID=90426 RepID=UPI0025F8D98C|nr:23S rRNA (pseudouridine(1915)-N(3))-methyltransferase RlmH [Methanothrix sp.]MCQ8903870.1 23S rRNA (pseudouridine(1915)-N(3))-methyltransferase RlmH [Methanothrix sp.]
MRIIAVGRIRERFWQDAASYYLKRLAPYTRLEVVEVREEDPFKEGSDVLAHLGGGMTVALDEHGESMTSLELASWLQSRIVDGCGSINWIIGGPEGLSQEVLDRSDLQLSLSRMTFPYQMARIILLEQLYRAFRIIRNEPYHR